MADWSVIKSSNLAQWDLEKLETICASRKKTPTSADVDAIFFFIEIRQIYYLSGH